MRFFRRLKQQRTSHPFSLVTETASTSATATCPRDFLCRPAAFAGIPRRRTNKFATPFVVI